MKFDRNTIIGFLVMGALLVGYILYNNKEQQSYLKDKAIKDSIANIGKPKPDTMAMHQDSVHADSSNRIANAGQYKQMVNGTEDVVYAENDVVKIAFTNKGGQPKWVELKGFKNQDSTPVRLAGSDYDKIGYLISTGSNSTISTSELFFSTTGPVKNADGSQTISYTLQSPDSNAAAGITHQFILRPGDYMVDFNILLKGASSLLNQGIMNMTWQYKAVQQESDIKFEKRNTQIGYVEDDDFDYKNITNHTSYDFNKPTQWVGVRQRFFNTLLVARSKQGFSNGNISWEIPTDEPKTIVKATALMHIAIPAATTSTIPFSIYYGPADYHLLTKYDLQFGKLVNLGQGMYSFVRPLNKFVIMPVFNFIKSFAGSLGLAIALLTIIIRLLISPLTYSSYLSGAKMKLLRPEIAQLKAKYGTDQQQMSMEQMKLFREAGVNPLGGCIPALLQIPIFFALYSFFNSNIDLRGEHFLWSKDLSAYDVILSFGHSSSFLPDHLSLFTITAVITSLLISLYSMSMTPDQSNPVLKYMPYIFPIFLFFIFNNLPSALTWYYTVSNLITLALQFIIQNYIIDHQKILAKMAENRKKPKPKSKWQERMLEMQEQQKKLKESQQKNKR